MYKDELKSKRGSLTENSKWKGASTSTGRVVYNIVTIKKKNFNSLIFMNKLVRWYTKQFNWYKLLTLFQQHILMPHKFFNNSKKVSLN